MLWSGVAYWVMVLEDFTVWKEEWTLRITTTGDIFGIKAWIFQEVNAFYHLMKII
jgi:hypothetical protein